MKYIKQRLKLLLLIGLCISLSSCEDMFEYSPFTADVDEERKGTTQINLDKISRLQAGRDSFKFAFITDSHYHYDNLTQVVNDINKRGDIAFTVFGGDITHQGDLKEYDLFYQIAQNLSKPYVTVIGNHDYKKNGGIIYNQMFGPFNYSFSFENFKLIMFDDVVWESNKNPDFNWLESQLSNNDQFDQVLVIAHLAPFSDQFTVNMEQSYTRLMSNYGIPLSIHGHGHVYTYTNRYEDDVIYIIGPWLKKPSYCIIHVSKDKVEVELVNL